MVFFTVKGQYGEYPQIVLNGKHFYMKAQEVILGSNIYREYATLSEDIRDLQIEVIDIDIPKDDINSVVSQYYSMNKTVTDFHPVYQSTIKDSYEPMYLESSFDFYQNLCDNFGVDRIADIVFSVIYENVTKKWVAGYFALEAYEVDFILDYLAIYYNFIDLSERRTNGFDS